MSLRHCSRCARPQITDFVDGCCWSSDAWSDDCGVRENGCASCVCPADEEDRQDGSATCEDKNRFRDSHDRNLPAWHFGRRKSEKWELIKHVRCLKRFERFG